MTLILMLMTKHYVHANQLIVVKQIPISLSIGVLLIGDAQMEEILNLLLHTLRILKRKLNDI